MNCTKSAKVADWPIEECCKFWKEIGTASQLNCPSQEGCQDVLSKLGTRGHKIIKILYLKFCGPSKALSLHRNKMVYLHFFVFNFLSSGFNFNQ